MVVDSQIFDFDFGLTRSSIKRPSNLRLTNVLTAVTIAASNTAMPRAPKKALPQIMCANGKSMKVDHKTESQEGRSPHALLQNLIAPRSINPVRRCIVDLFPDTERRLLN